LVCIVRENASNYVTGLRDADIPNIPSLVHTLQLVIDDGELAQPCVVSLLAAGRQLVGHSNVLMLISMLLIVFKNSLD